MFDIVFSQKNEPRQVGNPLHPEYIRERFALPRTEVMGAPPHCLAVPRPLERQASRPLGITCPIPGSHSRSPGAVMTVLAMAMSTSMVKTFWGMTPKS